MANKKAALKAARQSEKRAMANSSVRSKLKTLAKKVKSAAESGSSDIKAITASYVSALDKAVKRNIIHRNNANRKKSKVAKYFA